MPREKFILGIGAIVCLVALTLHVVYRPAILANPLAAQSLLVGFGAGVALTTYALLRIRVRELEAARKIPLKPRQFRPVCRDNYLRMETCRNQ